MRQVPSNAAAPMAAPSAAPATSASVDPNEARSSQFRAVSGNTESIHGGTLMVAAYALLWVLLLAFVVRVFLRQNAVAQSLDALDGAIRDKARK